MWYSSVPGRPPRAGKSTLRSRPRKFSPVLEPLEDRLAPAVFSVTSLADDNTAGSGSLRAAISASNATAGGNQINILVPGTYTLTLNGANDDNTAGDLDILTNGVTIQNQSGGSVIIDAGGLTSHDRVFDIAPTGPAVNVTIAGVTIRGGDTTDGGGGLRVQNGSSLVLIDDVVRNNTAGSAGGGGVLQLGGGNFTITNCLIAHNTAGKNTVVAKNTAGAGGHPDVDNDDQGVGLADGGHNFIGNNDGASAGLVAGTPNAQGSVVGTGAAPRDPLLAPLADNGGGPLPDGTHLLTHAALPSSGNDGVLDRGSDTGAPATDERGFPRPVDAHVDIGAFEFQDFDMTMTVATPAGPVHAGLPATLSYIVSNIGSNPSRGVTISETLPAGTFVVSASTGFTTTGTAAGNVVTLAVPDLAAGANARVTVTILPRDPGPLAVTAFLSPHDDPNTANNEASVTLMVLPHPTPVSGFADVTTLVEITRRGRRPSRKVLFLVTNTSGTPIQGPLGLVVVGLPRGVKLRNAGGLTSGRQKFVRLDAGGDNILDPGESASVQLLFSRPFNPRRLRVLAGAFAQDRAP